MGYERNDRRPSGDDRYGRGRGEGRGGYGRDRGGPSSYDYDERGFFDRAGDEVRSWFGDEEAERRRRYDERYDDRYARSDTARSGSYGRDDWDGDAYARSQGYDRGARAGGYGEGYIGRDRGQSSYGERGQSSYGERGYGRSGGWTGAGEYGADRSSGWDRGSGSDRSYGTDRDRYATQAGGTASDQSYRSWRDRQMATLDSDYDDYRRENQSRFESEFSTFRTRRQGQRDLLGSVQEHMEVVGSDGQHVGTVDHVRGDRIKLTKNDQAAGGHHHSIPSSWIESVDDKVTIGKTADQAKRAWREEDDGNDDDRGGLFGGQRGERDRQKDWSTDRNLNRSFSGTY